MQRRSNALPSIIRTLTLVTLALGCSDATGTANDAPALDHAAGPELAVRTGATTCPASLARYPVNGPHNGGWDPNALTYTCPGHPTSSKDNSDFIAGDHYGNDIFAAKGTPLVACTAGTITNVSTTSIGGNNIDITDACGWHYYYAHLVGFAQGLAVGQHVKPGDLIGYLGNTGSASTTSPHLHFSIYPEAYTSGIDPFPLLQTVDADSCAPGGGTVTPPGTVNPATPNMAMWSVTNAPDVYTGGPSKGIADVFEAQTFTVDLFIENKAGGKNTPDYVRIGYLVESPWLELVTWQIDTDWPKKDKATWVVNDADGAPDNPPKASPPATGQFNLYAMAQGESKRVRLTVRPKTYSIGATDHPDVRAWLWHVGNYYGESTAWDDPVETNLAGSVVRTYSQHDVYGTTHWEFEGAYAETEGWTIGNAISELGVNTVDHALAANQTGDDPFIISPALVAPTGTWKGLEITCRTYNGVKTGQLYWTTDQDGVWNDAKMVTFQTAGDAVYHTIIINPSTSPLWAGTVTRLRLDTTLSDVGWFDIASMRLVTEVPIIPVDADGDGALPPADCDDNDAARHPGAVETCDGVDNDCNGQVDEGVPAGLEACNGKDDDCSGAPGPSEVDVDGDGVMLCSGDCNDADAAVKPGATERCDGIDNDCDGTVDDGFQVGAICSRGAGACTAVGVVACGPTNEPMCTAAPAEPTAELCDGLDNDCDGAVDEDWGLGGPCTASGPKCTRAGVTKCTSAGEFICDAMPAEPMDELCNGVDDDCDGLTDETFDLGKACTTGVGACVTDGATACGDEGLGCVPIAVVAGGAETCNGLDDDCDGVVDDGFPLGQPCQVVTPDCTQTGKWICAPSGALACEATCVPGTDGGTDTTDGGGTDGTGTDGTGTDGGSTDGGPTPGAGSDVSAVAEDTSGGTASDSDVVGGGIDQVLTGGSSSGCAVGTEPGSGAGVMVLLLVWLATRRRSGRSHPI